MDKQYHLEQLVHLADLMENVSDDDSREGRRAYKEYLRDYKMHQKAAGLTLYKKNL